MDVTPGQAAVYMNQAMAAELRSARAILSITQQRLSDLSGVPMRTLTRLLSADRDINVEQLAQLAPVLETTPEELMARASTRARNLATVGGASEGDLRSRYATAASAPSEDDPTDDEHDL